MYSARLIINQLCGEKYVSNGNFGFQKLVILGKERDILWRGKEEKLKYFLS